MLKKAVSYTDFNGVEREEELYFNLSKPEIIMLETSEEGGLSRMLQEIIANGNTGKMVRFFSELILTAYGTKSEDGRRFIKNQKLREEFEQTEAYSALFMELLSDANAAAAFVNGIIPSDLAQQIALNSNTAEFKSLIDFDVVK